MRRHWLGDCVVAQPDVEGSTSSTCIQSGWDMGILHVCSPVYQVHSLQKCIAEVTVEDCGGRSRWSEQGCVGLHIAAALCAQVHCCAFVYLPAHPSGLGLLPRLP
jgi:hypothetical protein